MDDYRSFYNTAVHAIPHETGVFVQNDLLGVNTDHHVALQIAINLNVSALTLLHDLLKSLALSLDSVQFRKIFIL